MKDQPAAFAAGLDVLAPKPKKPARKVRRARVIRSQKA